MLGWVLVASVLVPGQPGAGTPPPPPLYPVSPPTPDGGFPLSFTGGAPRTPPDGLPASSAPGVKLPPLGNTPPSWAVRTRYDRPEAEGPRTVEVAAPLLPIPAIKPAEVAAAAEDAPAADRWPLMRALQGTYYGAQLDDNRLYLYGWVEGSMNASTNKTSNLPVTWTDRANEPLLQQAWLRFGRSVVTSGTTDPTVGFQVDILAGSDYRFTLPRGLLNSQLENAKGNQNIYGVDPIQEYVSLYVPTLFQGTEFRAGRVYTPWGVESLEAVSTPLVTRSYAFNSCPPFTHCGVAAYTTYSPVWSSMVMAANGNDVYFGDPAEEWRFVGNLKWTQPGGQNTVTLATSVGRGVFNSGAPFAPATTALANEPAGRNNFNVFDIVWTHTFNAKLAYNVEGIYGYQSQVPGIDNARNYGTADWMSVAHYLFYTISPEVLSTLRVETFDDFQGQRTGFKGLYTSVTGGLQYKPSKSLIIRPELRYDYNADSRPFEGKHGIFVAAADIILRF